MFGDLNRDPDLPLEGVGHLVAGTIPGRKFPLVFDRYNLRLKLYDLEASDSRDPELRFWQDGLRRHGDLYSKLIVYARPGNEMPWVTAGFLREGFISGFFRDGRDAHIWSAFGDDRRAEAPRDSEHDEIVLAAAAKPINEPVPAPGYDTRLAEVRDAPAIARLMDQTFDDYPSPITPAAIAEQIASGSHVFRFIVDRNGVLVACASAEIDHERSCAEMTDCATRPDQRGAGHMAYLLHRLAADVDRLLDIRDLYTLARADEVGMNFVFAKLGYNYTGRLVNNCRMPNGWESMNLWCLGQGPPDLDRGPAT